MRRPEINTPTPNGLNCRQRHLTYNHNHALTCERSLYNRPVLQMAWLFCSLVCSSSSKTTSAAVRKDGFLLCLHARALLHTPHHPSQALPTVPASLSSKTPCNPCIPHQLTLQASSVAHSLQPGPPQPSSHRVQVFVITSKPYLAGQVPAVAATESPPVQSLLPPPLLLLLLLSMTTLLPALLPNIGQTPSATSHRPVRGSVE